VHEVAETASSALPHLILATAGFPEVCDWRQFSGDGLTVKPAVIQVNDCFLCVLFTTKLYIDVSHQVIPQVITHVHLLHLSILLLHLREHFLKEVVIVLLHLHVADGTAYAICRLSRVLRVSVNIQEGNGLAEGGSVVKPGASISMSTGSDFEVKRTIYFVFFCSEDRSQVFRHV